MTATGMAVRARGLRKIYRPARYREVAALAARVAGPDGEIPGLTVTRPSLEDTYLRLIGATPNGPGTPEVP